MLPQLCLQCQRPRCHFDETDINVSIPIHYFLLDSRLVFAVLVTLFRTSHVVFLESLHSFWVSELSGIQYHLWFIEVYWHV